MSEQQDEGVLLFGWSPSIWAIVAIILALVFPIIGVPMCLYVAYATWNKNRALAIGCIIPPALYVVLVLFVLYVIHSFN